MFQQCCITQENPQDRLSKDRQHRDQKGAAAYENINSRKETVKSYPLDENYAD
ncbi:MAG: hypothetical protein J6O13_13845 [Selenomonas sp.]|nr:hypothetical protein [Selenomonas sp.]